MVSRWIASVYHTTMSTVRFLLLLLLLISNLLVPNSAQQLQCNPLTVQVYDSEQACNTGQAPMHVGQVVPDNTCRSTFVESGNASYLPGLYTANCISPDRMSFNQSGCLFPNCGSFSGQSSCARDLGQMSALYGRLDPPLYIVQASVEQCLVLNDATQNLSVIFAIQGNCSCITTASENTTNPTTSPAAGPSPAPVATPTTRRPTMVPTPTPVDLGRPIGGPPVVTTPAPAPKPTRLPTTAPQQGGPLQPQAEPTTATPGVGTTSPPTAAKSEENVSASSNVGAIAGGVVGGVVGLAAVLILGFWLGTSRQKLKSQASAASPTPITSFNGSSQTHTKEIILDKEDDVSTLGTPLGVAFLQEENTTGSVGYDYAEQRPRAATEESESMLDSAYSTTMGTRATSLLLSDDASFEQQFQDELLPTPMTRFQVTVPPGKLGMVIDTPRGFPQVHAIKGDSILAGTVQVGDCLESVDAMDVTDLTCMEVSQLISRKSDQERVLVFRRGAAAKPVSEL